MTRREDCGHAWETRVGEYLAARGLKILAQRYRCRLGELDLVCQEDGTLVIVEVRARSTWAIATALESVDRNKQRKIIQATRHLLMRNPRWERLAIRFDVVAVSNIDADCPTLEWVRNAFENG
jgi:putative endonuclease